MIVRILDMVSSILILLGLWNAPKNKKWWLVYLAGSIPFTVLCLIKGLYFLTAFGIVTMYIGIKNYLYTGTQVPKISTKKGHVAQTFTCDCGQMEGWITEGALTKPCPKCGRIYFGIYSQKKLGIEAILVGVSDDN